jgi:hypothetical protein
MIRGVCFTVCLVVVASCGTTQDRRAPAGASADTQSAMPAAAKAPASVAASAGTGFSDTSSARIPVSAMLVNGIGINAPEHRVREAFGTPRSTSKPVFDEMLGDSVVIWSYDSLDVQLAAHRLLELRCRSKRCVTAAGLRPGSSREAVVAAYGQGFGGYQASRDALMYFQQQMACSLAFDFARDVVIQITLQCDNS